MRENERYQLGKVRIRAKLLINPELILVSVA